MKENSSVVSGGELAVVRGAQRYHNVSSSPHFVNFFLFSLSWSDFLLGLIKIHVYHFSFFPKRISEWLGSAGDPRRDGGEHPF